MSKTPSTMSCKTDCVASSDGSPDLWWWRWWRCNAVDSGGQVVVLVVVVEVVVVVAVEVKVKLKVMGC